MSESTLQSSLVPLGLPPSPIAGAPSGTILDRFDNVFEHQENTEWCWAAVSTSVANYYHGPGSVRQCDVVSSTLGRNCCPIPVPDGCNVPWALDQGLTTVGDFAPPILSQRLTLSQLASEIDAGRPVGVRVVWGNNAGAHFVAIGGYSQDGTLDVQDPWYGPKTTPYNKFATAYQGSGTWSHSYHTVGSAVAPPNPPSNGQSTDPWTPQVQWPPSTAPTRPPTRPAPTPQPPPSQSSDPWVSQVPGWGAPSSR